MARSPGTGPNVAVAGNANNWGTGCLDDAKTTREAVVYLQGHAVKRWKTSLERLFGPWYSLCASSTPMTFHVIPTSKGCR